MFLTNRLWFVFFRLHHILYERLNDIKKISTKQAVAHAKQGKKASAVAIMLALKAPLDIAMDGYYEAFLKMCEQLIDGVMEPTTFEEATREMFNIHAYKVFTIDKLLNNVTKKVLWPALLGFRLFSV